jgi:hypothetical protein
MKTIIKLAITLVLLNVAARAGIAAWGYYQLKDATQQMVTFGAQVSTTDLHNRILEKAAELNVPLPPEGVNVHRQGIRTWAEAMYTQPLELFPNYTYPVQLSFSVDAYSMTAGPNEDKQ